MITYIIIAEAHWNFPNVCVMSYIGCSLCKEPLSFAPKISKHQTILKVHDLTTATDHHPELRSPYKAHNMLGHYKKDPAVTQAEQYRQLHKQSDALTTFLWRCRPLTKLKTWAFYFACYLPSMSCSLSSLSLSRCRLDKNACNCRRRAMSIIFPRCRFNRNTKHAILYGPPIELGGANFRHLYVKQGIGQVGYSSKIGI